MSKAFDTKDLRRISSGMLGGLVEIDEAKVYLINEKGTLTLLTEDKDVTDSVLVGKGNQGSVHAVVVECETNEGLEKRLCVLKQLPLQKNTLGQKSRSKTEPLHIHVTAKQITSIQYNVIQGMAVIENQGAQFLLMPFSGLFLGDIINALPALKEDKTQSHLHNSIILHMLNDLLAAIKFMHEDMRTVHQDIKEDNISYYNGHGVLVDLGTASPADVVEEKTAGSCFYMHPLSLLGKGFLGKEFQCQKQSDIYAMGIVLKLMLGDEETVEKRKEWEQCTSPIQKISVESYAAIALFQKRRDTKPVVPDLEKVLGRFNSVQRKLEELAKLITTPWPFDQPTIDQLITYCNNLKNQFLKSREGFGSAIEQEAELRAYYESLIKKRKTNHFLSLLNQDITTPLCNTTSPVSLFNASIDASDASCSQSLNSLASLSSSLFGKKSGSGNARRSTRSALDARVPSPNSSVVNDTSAAEKPKKT